VYWMVEDGASGEGIPGEGSARPGCSTTTQLVHIQLHYSTQFNSIRLNKMIFCAFPAVDLADWPHMLFNFNPPSLTLQRKVQKSERRFNRATVSLNNSIQDSVSEYQSVIAKKSSRLDPWKKL
jgi:hypothetical protein